MFEEWPTPRSGLICAESDMVIIINIMDLKSYGLKHFLFLVLKIK